MKLISVTLSGEIIKLEQPELQLCLFWPKKVVFKFWPLEAYFEMLKWDTLSAVKLASKKAMFFNFWPNRMNEKGDKMCWWCFGFFFHKFIPAPWSDWKIDWWDFFHCIHYAKTQKTEAMLVIQATDSETKMSGDSYKLCVFQGDAHTGHTITLFSSDPISCKTKVIVLSSQEHWEEIPLIFMRYWHTMMMNNNRSFQH